MELKQQTERQSKMLLNLEIVLGAISVISFLIMFYVGILSIDDPQCGITMPRWTAIVMIAAGSLIFITGVWCCLRIEQKAGYYQCSGCGGKYVPTMTQVILAVHNCRSRRMKCPHCGKRCWAHKTLTGDVEV